MTQVFNPVNEASPATSGEADAIIQETMGEVPAGLGNCSLMGLRETVGVMPAALTPNARPTHELLGSVSCQCRPEGTTSLQEGGRADPASQQAEILAMIGAINQSGAWVFDKRLTVLEGAYLKLAEPPRGGI